MSLMDVVRIEIVDSLTPDNVGGLPDYFWVIALAVIVITSIIMKWRDPEMGERGIMNRI